LSCRRAIVSRFPTKIETTDHWFLGSLAQLRKIG